jgi:hypothetical protein
MNSPNSEKLTKAMADKLEHTLTKIKNAIFKAVNRGDLVSAQYYREQYAVTEVIIYAIRNNRIARTDEDVERLVNAK